MKACKVLENINKLFKSSFSRVNFCLPQFFQRVKSREFMVNMTNFRAMTNENFEVKFVFTTTVNFPRQQFMVISVLCFILSSYNTWSDNISIKEQPLWHVNAVNFSEMHNTIIKTFKFFIQIFEFLCKKNSIKQGLYWDADQVLMLLEFAIFLKFKVLRTF